MRRARVYLALFSTILVFLWLLPEGMVAQDINKTALVIRHSDQSVQTACVEFSEAELNGVELLQRSGFDMEIDVQGLGALVCSIEQTGCPPDDCWCQCKGGGECTYWSYWHQLNGEWQYAQGGASMYAVQDGDLEGWSWGPGSANAAFPPPDIIYDDVCTDAAVDVATATPSITPTSIVFVPDDTPTSAPIQSKPTSTVTATPLPSATVPATVTTAAVATAEATNTAMPTSTATVVLAAVEQPTNVPVEPEFAAGAAGTVSEPVVVVDQNPVPTETLEPTPSPVTAPVVDEAPLPASEVVAVVAAAPVATRPLQRDIKNFVEKKVDLNQELTVVGADVQVADLRVMQPGSENQIIAIEDEDSSRSLLSYAAFGVIVLTLSALLLMSTVRRRGRQYASGE